MKVVQHRDFVNRIGTYHVVGEVQNLGPQHARDIRITATFYNASGGIVGTGSTSADVGTLRPGEEAPFDVFDMNAKDISTYKLTVTSTPTSKATSREAVVLGNWSWVDTIDSRHIVGEIENRGSRNLEFVKVVASFYNESGGFVAGETAYVKADILRPGEVAPFEIISLGDDPGAAYTLFVEGRETSSAPADASSLVIVSNASQPQQYGGPRILGEIQNQGTKTARLVEVVATMYDGTGAVIDVDFTFTSPSDVAPGQSVPFELSTTRKDVTLASWKLRVEPSRFE